MSMVGGWLVVGLWCLKPVLFRVSATRRGQTVLTVSIRTWRELRIPTRKDDDDCLRMTRPLTGCLRVPSRANIPIMMGDGGGMMEKKEVSTLADRDRVVRGLPR